MPRIVSSLFRYPIKGLSAEALPVVQLQRGCAFPHDRQFAIVHRNSKFSIEHPAWIARRNFLVLAYSPSIAVLSASYDPGNRMIKLVCEERHWQVPIDDDDATGQLNRALDYLSIDSQPGPYEIAEVEGRSLTDSPEPLISLMNTRSLADLAEKTGYDLEPARFRGNVWYDGEKPWEERRWPGQVLSLGNVQVRVVEEIVRCRAIDVNPGNGQRDAALLSRLGGMYGHTYFGVLAEVLQSGRLSVGDAITESQSTPPGSLGI